jgi:hypothetical protein
MFERVPEPNVQWVDQQIGRKPGEFAETASACLLWLQHKLKVHSICGFNTKAYLDHGLDYLKQYYQKEWTDGWDAFFTPNRVAQLQEKRRQAHNQISNFPSYSERLDIPTIDDIDAALARKKIVCLCLNGDGTGNPSAHLTFIYGYRDGKYLMYIPSSQAMSDFTFVEIPHDGLANPPKGTWLYFRPWLPKEGLVIVGE